MRVIVMRSIGMIFGVKGEDGVKKKGCSSFGEREYWSFFILY